MMSDTNHLKDTDWAAMLRLAAEVAALPLDVQVRRAFVLDRLCSLVGGATAGVYDVNQAAGGGLAVQGSYCGVKSSPERLAAFGAFLYSPRSRGDVFNSLALPALQRHGTVVRRQVLDNSAWYDSPNYQLNMKPWGLDDRIHGWVPTPDGNICSMAIVRETSDEPFSERDIQVLNWFNRQAAAVYVTPLNEVDRKINGLAPRLRPVVRRLLAGDSEKQAALALGYSPHTVHQYVKTIYRDLGVNSRGELHAIFK